VGAHARRQLAERKGLHDVVGGTEVESTHAILHLASRRQHDDRDPGIDLANLREHLEAVEAGQHDVEDDQVRGAGEEGAHGGRSVGGEFDYVPLRLQPLFDERGDQRFVFDQQNQHADMLPSADERFLIGVRTGPSPSRVRAPVRAMR
jgi:hypothetical protein